MNTSVLAILIFVVCSGVSPDAAVDFFGGGLWPPAFLL
jgi:hypothetical protein